MNLYFCPSNMTTPRGEANDIEDVICVMFHIVSYESMVGPAHFFYYSYCNSEYCLHYRISDFITEYLEILS